MRDIIRENAQIEAKRYLFSKQVERQQSRKFFVDRALILTALAVLLVSAYLLG